jgi:hypothetical protein
MGIPIQATIDMYAKLGQHRDTVMYQLRSGAVFYLIRPDTWSPADHANRVREWFALSNWALPSLDVIFEQEVCVMHPTRTTRRWLVAYRASTPYPGWHIEAESRDFSCYGLVKLGWRPRNGFYVKATTVPIVTEDGYAPAALCSPEDCQF